MLATARLPAPPFPHAGATALYDGNEVTIYQRIDTDHALIHGPGITARVPIADLAPASTRAAFELWHDDRLSPVADGAAPTPETDLYADFVVWLETTDYEANRYASRADLARALTDAGYRPTRIPTDSFVRGRRLSEYAWNVALVGESA